MDNGHCPQARINSQLALDKKPFNLLGESFLVLNRELDQMIAKAVTYWKSRAVFPKRFTNSLAPFDEHKFCFIVKVLKHIQYCTLEKPKQL